MLSSFRDPPILGQQPGRVRNTPQTSLVQNPTARRNRLDGPTCCALFLPTVRAVIDFILDIIREKKSLF